MKHIADRRPQQGMASLVMALILMTSMTLIAVTTANTLLTETRMAGNAHAATRLRLLAESALADATQRLVTTGDDWKWVADKAAGGASYRESLPASVDEPATELLYRRAAADDPLVAIGARVTPAARNAPHRQVSQTLRLLTVLSPLGESAPPLVMNGCPGRDARLDIYPLDSDRDTAADALWQFGRQHCPESASVDLHRGRRVQKPAIEDLWQALFSISREAYARLAQADRRKPTAQRTYWQAEPSIGNDAVRPWSRSLGTGDRPVVLVFPADSGCPAFAAGVRIVGVVYVESTCGTPLAAANLEITGALIVNGALATGTGKIRLRHIQALDPERQRLALPVLRAVALPGSWSDF